MNCEEREGIGDRRELSHGNGDGHGYSELATVRADGRSDPNPSVASCPVSELYMPAQSVRRSAEHVVAAARLG